MGLQAERLMKLIHDVEMFAASAAVLLLEFIVVAGLDVQRALEQLDGARRDLRARRAADRVSRGGHAALPRKARHNVGLGI